ncbi:GNAT family N-acetyltransferase [Prochlorococcus marinus]|uniref:Ribosomal-protein-alanine N-acetyltransferase n=1 Tax=Prochlorococcus marinus (strain MIT 9211) TaxID=93059 RepID=A9BAN0_PROM4|nr:GNAT family N-acetyltransferase [Prochlorococcus marinus]ABX08892.1 Ribosomal-protein-alanine N-acetyltransferase [Prochlorococcus marinus str. MIT 9211]
MDRDFNIRTIQNNDILKITELAKEEGFAPGIGDVNIYRNTDRQGLWVACLNDSLIGSIVGVKYNSFYGFIGLFIVDKQFRGRGFGLALWKHVLLKLSNLDCIGLEAAPDRIDDYSSWGFQPSSRTTRWEYIGDGKQSGILHSSTNTKGLILLQDSEITEDVIQNYDMNKEPTPRPHFLSDWLFNNNSSKVLALTNSQGSCVGFGRIRKCLLKKGIGWRIGPLIADTPELASILLKSLLLRHPGVILIDTPGLNPLADNLMKELGFKSLSHTMRMYKGTQPSVSMKEIYGLACLELG